MRKHLFIAICLGLFIFAGAIQSRAETTGIYAAPKFLMMWQNAHVDMDFKVEGIPVSGEAFRSQFTLGGALAVGYDFWSQYQLPIRAELEFAMRGNNEEKDSNEVGSYRFKYNASTLMANFYYDFRNESAFTPYVGAGVGLAFIGVDNKMDIGGVRVARDDETFTNFAFNLGAGVAYNFTDNLAVDLGYRYLNMGYVESTGSRNVSGVNVKHTTGSYLYNHEIMLGARVTF